MREDVTAADHASPPSRLSEEDEQYLLTSELEDLSPTSPRQSRPGSGLRTSTLQAGDSNTDVVQDGLTQAQRKAAKKRKQRAGQLVRDARSRPCADSGQLNRQNLQKR